MPIAIASQAKWSVDGGVTQHNSGATITVSAGMQQIRFSGVNYYTCPQIQNIIVNSSVANNITATYTKGPIQLSFPLKGKSPYDIKINSVCDHSRPSTSYYDQSDDKVVAYTGEVGDKFKRNVPGFNYYGWTNQGGTQFLINGFYI